MKPKTPITPLYLLRFSPVSVRWNSPSPLLIVRAFSSLVRAAVVRGFFLFVRLAAAGGLILSPPFGVVAFGRCCWVVLRHHRAPPLLLLAFLLSSRVVVLLRCRRRGVGLATRDGRVSPLDGTQASLALSYITQVDYSSTKSSVYEIMLLIELIVHNLQRTSL